MKELMIYEYQAKEIEDILRLVKNIYRYDKEVETCFDRKLEKATKFIKETLKQQTT